jgi:peptidase M1-like protein
MKLALSAFALLCISVPAAAPAAERSPRDRYNSLNALRVDSSAVYTLGTRDLIELRRGDVLITLEEGKVALFAPFDGRITGAVFSGRGHALAMPRDAVEKQQMARFLGAPVLDQHFVSAYIRFTDDTAAEILRQLQSANIPPHADPSFALRWDDALARLNPSHSLRILFEEFSQDPKPYFHAGLDGILTGPFDVLYDEAREESLLLGQPRRVGNATFYDTWASYPVPGVAPPHVAFHALHYAIDATILPNHSLEATATVRLRGETGGERLLIFQLSRALTVQSVTSETGEPLTFFQNEGLSVQQRNTLGSDSVYVFLPQVLPSGTESALNFRYRGNVVEDAGNGVLFVGARDSWYPRFGDASEFSQYDLTMHWPRRLRLVATGNKLDEREDGEFRVAHWKTEQPATQAGFNLGDYASASIVSQFHSVEVFANRELEPALSSRIAASRSDLPSDPPVPGESSAANRMGLPALPPSPADALKQLARDIDSSIHFYEQFSGPFPYARLNVSQIPGAFGQGWPGLLYLSTFSFLPANAQQRAGLNSASQQQFTEIVPFHEVAHQWWGNIVGWSNYRDQWIDEAIANYLALLFADGQKNPDHSLKVWLDRYRKHLVEKAPGMDIRPADVGPLALGSRLDSSKSPGAYDDVIYTKGTWVIHMLREQLRQPGSRNPDARFISLLNTLSVKYAYRALSTADLQHELEAVMTPKMDLEGERSMEWFFDQWVRGTGIPHYRVEFNVRRGEKGFLVRGKLFQTGVLSSFLVAVPLYAGTGHTTLLGTVLASGPETSFHFTTQLQPHKIFIDPQMTLLCTTE